MLAHDAPSPPQVRLSRQHCQRMCALSHSDETASSLDDTHDVAVGGLDVGEEVAAGGRGSAGEGL